MIKVKDTVNFKTLRDKGPAALEVEGDQVIQIVGKDSSIKVVMSQDYFLRLVSAYDSILISKGLREESRVQPGNLEQIIQRLEGKLISVVKKTNES